MDAARAEGRLRFGGRARRAQSRLSQHRHVQRRVAAALQRRWSAASRSPPSRSPSRAKNSAYFEATEAQTPDMALFFLKTTGPHHLKDAPGGDTISDQGRGAADARQGCVRGELRALPFEQTARSRARPRSRRLRRQGLSRLLEQILGSGPRPTSSRSKMREIVTAPTISSTTTICRPNSACRSRCCRPTRAVRWRPTRSAATSGTTSRRSLIRICRRSARSPGTIPSPASRSDYTMPAGGRGYTRPPSLISLWSTAPFLLNNTVGKFDPSPSVDARMRVVQRFDREDAVAGTPRSRRGARDQDPRHDRPHRPPRVISRSPPAICRTPSRSAGHRRAPVSVGVRRRRDPHRSDSGRRRRSPCSPTSICSLRIPIRAARPRTKPRPAS